MITHLIIFFCLLNQITVFAQANPKVEIYFNAATEEYLRSNFSKTVENLEKALELEPGNEKIKNFLVKVLFEAGEYHYLKHNYLLAYNYLEKAKKLAPEDKEVNELYQLTKSLFEKPSRPPAGEVQPPLEKKIEKVQVESEATKEKKEIVRKPEPQEKVITKEKVLYLPVGESKLSKKQVLYLGAIAGLSLFLLLLFLSVINSTLRRLKMDIYSASQSFEEKIQQLNEEIKKRNIIEMKSLEEGKESLERSLKIGLEKLRVDFNTELKKIMPKKRTKTVEQTLLLQQQEKILLELKGEKFEDEPASLQEARQRMIKAAISLYQFNSELALRSLKQTLKHDNPAVRLNTVLALAEIGNSETVELLLGILSESDFGVKRTLLEVLTKLKNNSLLPENIRQKIFSVLKEEKLKREWIF